MPDPFDSTWLPCVATGSAPVFDEPVHVGRPSIPDRADFFARVSSILDRRWLTNDGECVRELEARLRELLGVRHCIVTCNGTIALEIAARAAGLSGEVIVPSFTFVATANALQWQGITPVFCDVDPVDHLIDIASVERAITPRTTGIVAVHIWGQPCRPAELAALAERRGLTLLYDAAHAFSCGCDGRPIGGFGAAEIFSFHATKFFNTSEGGAIATNDDAIARRARLIRNFGFSGYDAVEAVGINGKMPEICAAMGLSGLGAITASIERNRNLHRRYTQELQSEAGIRVLPYDAQSQSNYQYVVLDIDPLRCSLKRDELLDVLWSENVLARRYFYPGCHKMAVYRDSAMRPDLPGVERAAEGVLVLPTGASVDDAQVPRIAAILRCALRNSSCIRDALSRRERRF